MCNYAAFWKKKKKKKEKCFVLTLAFWSSSSLSSMCKNFDILDISFKGAT